MIWIWLGLAVVIVAAGGWLYRSRGTYHLETVQAGVLYRCGLQSYREFENALRQVKPRTVVSLVDDREIADPEKNQFKREMESLVAGSATQVMRVPVRLGGWPDGDELQRFLAVVADPKKQPVLVH